MELSGVRIDEIHGPFCHPLRQVLQLTPDGRATSCFLSTGSEPEFDAVVAFGDVDRITGNLRIDEARVALHRRQAARIPRQCESCHNVHHCARDCPDVCLLVPESSGDAAGGFRCRVQQLVGRELILEMAKKEY